MRQARSHHKPQKRRIHANIFNLPDTLVNQLHHKAAQSNVSLDELAVNLFNMALAEEWPELPPVVEAEEDGLTLEEVVARIKTMPKNPAAIKRATKSVDELIADLAANPPSPELLTIEEMEPLWEAFEQELKAFDHAQDIAEGRIYTAVGQDL